MSVCQAEVVVRSEDVATYHRCVGHAVLGIVQLVQGIDGPL